VVGGALVGGAVVFVGVGDGLGLVEDGFGVGRSTDGSDVGLKGGGLLTGKFAAGAGGADPDFDGLARAEGWADDEGAVPLGAELGPCVDVTDTDLW
jgi:hypothetical protein